MNQIEALGGHMDLEVLRTKLFDPDQVRVLELEEGVLDVLVGGPAQVLPDVPDIVLTGDRRPPASRMVRAEQKDSLKQVHLGRLSWSCYGLRGSHVEHTLRL